MRHAARTDSNQVEVVKALRAIGAKVYYLKLPLDLLVWFRGETSLMEVKTEDGKLTKQQVEFIAEWPGTVHIVQSPQAAVAAVIGPEAMK
jgi:hypothetical protein